jgi:hypothetical protein
MSNRPRPTKQQRERAIKTVIKLMKEIVQTSNNEVENELRNQLIYPSFMLTTKRLQIIRDNLVKEFINQNKPIETIERIYDVFPNLDKKF